MKCHNGNRVSVKRKAKIEFQLKGAKQNKTKEEEKTTDSGTIVQREEKLHT